MFLLGKLEGKKKKRKKRMLSRKYYYRETLETKDGNDVI